MLAPGWLTFALPTFDLPPLRDEESSQTRPQGNRHSSETYTASLEFCQPLRSFISNKRYLAARRKLRHLPAHQRLPGRQTARVRGSDARIPFEVNWTRDFFDFLRHEWYPFNR